MRQFLNMYDGFKSHSSFNAHVKHPVFVSTHGNVVVGVVGVVIKVVLLIVLKVILKSTSGLVESGIGVVMGRVGRV